MAITKPTVDSATWGNTNTSSPDQVTPGAGLINTGFLAYPTKLKRGHLNWLIGKLHQGLRYYMAQGLPAWDASEANYAVGSVVSYGGTYYKLTASPPAGTAPDVDTSHWGLLFGVIPGTLLARRVITASGSYAKTAGTVRARFRIVGAGGAGAGVCAATGPGKWSSGGGASGSWAEFETTTIPAANWVVVAGALGAGGSAPVADSTYTAGGSGGSTTFSDGTNTFTVPGGGGAPGLAGGAPGGLPTASPGGTIIFAADGQRGEDGEQQDASIGSYIRAGGGGSTPCGAGAPGRSQLSAPDGSPITPYASTGNGAGGSGTCSYNATTGNDNGSPGAAGRPMLIILEEWS